MSSVSFTVSPENLIPQGRTEQLPQFVAKKPPHHIGEFYVEVIPLKGDTVWTTGSIVTQPR